MTTESSWNMIQTGSDVNVPTLVDSPGYESVITGLSGEARTLYYSSRNNAMFGVFGSKVYRFSTNLIKSEVGTLSTSAGPVYISENQNSEIAIVDGQKLYVYDYSNFTFNEPVIDFKPLYIDYQDTFLIATGDDANWHLSGSNDAQTWNPLVKNTMQTSADDIVAAVKLNRQMWIIGKKVTELWHNQGRPLFPYARDNSIAIDYGCLSRESIAKGFGILIWLGVNDSADARIVATEGGPPQEVSLDGLDFEFGKLQNPEDSFGFLYEHDGHIFYQLTFRKDNKTFVYDFKNKLFYNASDSCFNHHIARLVKLFNKKLYFISFDDSNVYRMGSDITTYDGKIIPRVRVTPNLRFPANDTFIVKRIKIQLEQGVNNDVSRVDLSISTDGGYTFSNIISKELLPLGVRENELQFDRLGSSNDFVFQFRFWGTGRFVITNAVVEIRR